MARTAQDELTVLEDGLEALRDEIRGRGFDGGRLSHARFGIHARPHLITAPRRGIIDRVAHSKESYEYSKVVRSRGDRTPTHLTEEQPMTQTITPEEAADRLAIRELIDAYAHRADRRDTISFVTQ